MDQFRARLNCIDHYQARPSRYDPQLRNDVRPSQASKGPKVPVVRVFGSTETGQKVCAHIHGAFPYLYIEYGGSLEPEEVGTYIYRLHLSIDHALAISYRRDQHGVNAQFVARITLVKGVPFYGFHVGYRFFLKIYMFNPLVMTRLADLLQQGTIMKQSFQPYEAHLQYLLQFLVDYNLYGCDYLDASTVKFRAPIPERDEGLNSSHKWHSLSIPDSHVTEEGDLPRVSHCSIEVDVMVQDILNRGRVQARPLHHDFIERLSPLPLGTRLVPSMAGLWKDETKRRRRRMGLSQKGSSPFPPEDLVSMSANPRETEAQAWIHEEEYRQLVSELVADEESGPGGKRAHFDDYGMEAPRSSSINTTLQSVEDLFPNKLMPVLGLPSLSQDLDVNLTSSIDVDDQMVLQADVEEDDFFPDDSDEEALAQIVDHGRVEPSRVSQARQRDSAANQSLDLVQSSSSTMRGVCKSGLTTRSIPHMPIYQDLIEVAEDLGLVSRSKDAIASKQNAVSMLKRGLPNHYENEIHLKRAKLQEGESKRSSSTITSPNKNMSSTPNPTASQSRKSLLSPSTLSSQENTLNFAVTKNQGSPRKFRQKSNASPVQPSQGLTLSKGVSFEPASTVRSRDSASTNLDPSTNVSNTSEKEQLLEGQQTAVRKFNRAHSFVTFSGKPPIAAEAASLQGPHIPHVVYQDAYYSKEKDVPARLREYAGREFRLDSNTLLFLPDFDVTGTAQSLHGTKKHIEGDRERLEDTIALQKRRCSLTCWEVALLPPTFADVDAWCEAEQRQESPHMGGQGKLLAKVPAKKYASQIEGPTPKNKHGFKYTQRKLSTSVQHEAQYMSTMSLEIHVNTRGRFVPNPEEDEVQCVFWSAKSDEAALSSQNPADAEVSGIIVLCNDKSFTKKVQAITGGEVIEERSELDLMVRMVEIVRTHDPDVLTGYEVHGSSWGYLIERARLKYDFNLCDEFSRMKAESHGRFGKENDRWGFNTTSTIRVTGRHMINIWRAMRGELNLLQYTMENVVWHVLHRRIPHYPWKALTAWYQSGKVHEIARLLKYYQIRTKLDIEILEANELIPRTSEQARLLGVDFFSVFSRGSQFKVESIMFRIAKPENFVLVSPNRKQVGGQNALECLPLVMEPQSAFYNSPLLVLDFQSLYPSVMIAYNLCYSTFLGRITNWRGMNKMGFTEYKRQEGILALLKDYINIAPNGMMYVKTEIRKSLLAKMLSEILETRVMVKGGMKQDKDDRTLQRLLNNRQLALKLLANVTYGYTSASFSGRMPCSEIADSIVQTGRETLERAIAYIHSVEGWGAEVVYGDTDSLFVYLKGRTRAEAFDIGNEIAKAITNQNPRPVKLKFEKVYHPCVLLAKKRYVGYKYESKEQAVPEFDAKGIETVRRDGTPAEQKIEEKALKLLFETADLSQIKEYFRSQCEKIMRGNVSVQDFCFAKEVRLGTYSDKGPPPAGALISTRKMLQDARAEPQYGERVPYVVISGAPGARLIDRCVAPEELLANPHWTLDSEYYISKNLIPPLERIFNLVGANVRAWFDEMPRVQRIYQSDHPAAKRITLESYMKSSHCLNCSRKFTKDPSRAYPLATSATTTTATDPIQDSLCPQCRSNPPTTIVSLQTRLTKEQKRYQDLLKICQTCANLSPAEDVRCDSKDCPVFWTRMKQQSRISGEMKRLDGIVGKLVEGVSQLDLEW